jgi:hypothetical protein
MFPADDFAVQLRLDLLCQRSFKPGLGGVVFRGHQRHFALLHEEVQHPLKQVGLMVGK